MLAFVCDFEPLIALVQIRILLKHYIDKYMKCLLSCAYYIDIGDHVMTIGLLSGLFGTNKSVPHPTSSCGCSGSSGYENANLGGGSFGAGLLDSKSGLLGTKFNLISRLLGGISGGSSSGSHGSYGNQGGSFSGSHGSYGNQGGSFSGSHGSYGNQGGSFSGSHGSCGNQGGSFSGSHGSCGNQGGSFSGSYGGAGSSSSNGLGSAVGGLASGVHQFAEKAISATGLGSAFAPIDAAVVHPLLWDPISRATGVDVSKHPEGVRDVSNPLGVERNRRW